MLLLRVPLYLALFFLTFWIYSYLVAKDYPEKPPMAEATSRYEEHFNFAASWPYFYKYYLYKPDGYDQNRKYPLLVLLHGVSRHMYGGKYVLADAIRQKHPSFILVPIAPKSMIWGYPRWTEERSAAPLAFDALRAVQNAYSIDPDRIYISGYSMGGTGTFAMLEEHPDTFAAALVLCGAWDPRRADRFPSDVPIVLARGSEDKPEPSRVLIAALQQQGKPANYIEYRGVGHNVWDAIYPDPRIWDWLFAQHRKYAPGVKDLSPMN